jgi:hypothetical protein
MSMVRRTGSPGGSVATRERTTRVATPPKRSVDDPVVSAIDDLSEAVRQNVEDERVLTKQLRVLRTRRVRGATTRELLEGEEAPPTLGVVTQVLSRIGNASGVFRRTLADNLTEEGVSVTGIARLFGVTHQRTSALLRRSRRAEKE